jgi:hypothetical protein
MQPAMLNQQAAEAAVKDCIRIMFQTQFVIVFDHLLAKFPVI